jgi:zinc-binding alcohol dehydrogenase/oxidoreductase
MQAVVLERHGDPDVLRLSDVPDPQAPDGWIVVELRAAAVNWHDCLLRRGQYPQFPLPRIPGSDGAGVRRDTGEAVIILPSLCWGDDERAPGPGWEILGDRTDGTYAELVAVPESCVRPKPAGWSFEDAAALPLAGLTAHRALFARGGLRSGETVLILGAGGGVAGIAIGLARLAGARVLVTTSSPEKLDQARAHGAEDGVLYTDERWPAAVRELAGTGGIDLVIDPIGSTWPQALEALSPGGRLVTFGATGGSTVQIDVRRFYFGQQTILGTTMGSPRDFDALLRRLETDPTWRPAVGHVLALGDVVDAHKMMQDRRHHGKIVLTVNR